MKLRPQHAQFLASHIVLGLSRSTITHIAAPLPTLNRLATQVIQEDLQKEAAIERRARELLEEHQDEIEEGEIDERQLFSMIKKQIAKEEGFALTPSERYSRLAHRILDELVEEKGIVCKVPENAVKSLILGGIEEYLRFQEDAYDAVMAKLRNYKKKLIAGSDEYELIFTRLYEEEMNKRG